MIKPRSCLLVAASFLVLTAIGAGQDKPAQPTFEVASIKLSKPGERDGWIKAMPGGQEYTAHNFPVKLMISLMYKVPMRQITGTPDWLDTDRYDIEAKADQSYSLDDLHAMFRTLLADRFKLAFHKEIKEGPVYALVVDPSGLKMKVNEGEQTYAIPITYSKDNIVGTRVSMSYLCWWLGQQLQSDQRPVIDKTDLSKNYDFTLTFAPQRPPDFGKENLPAEVLDRPSIFDAVKQQLGLRLQAQKGPVEYYVVDHIERPSAN